MAIAERTPTQTEPTAPRARWWVLAAVAVGTMMAGLDSSVSNTVLPVIAGALHADVASAEWVVSVYLLVLSALLLSFGRLGKSLRRKPRRSLCAALTPASSASATPASPLSLAKRRAISGITCCGRRFC